MPPDSPEPEEEPGKQEEEEMALMEAEEPDQQVPAFNRGQAVAKFAVAQFDEMTEQQAIPESIQDEAYVEAKPGVPPGRRSPMRSSLSSTRR